MLLLWVEPEPAHAPSGAAIYGAALQEVRDLIEQMRAQSEAELQHLADELRDEGTSTAVRIERGDAADAIVRVAGEEQVDLVVTGTKGLTGFKRFFLGSVASKVARMSPVPVLVTRGTVTDFQRILVGTDFSPSSERALALAVASAAPGASIDVCHVWQEPGGLDAVAVDDALLAEMRHDMVENATVRGNALLQRHQDERVSLHFVLRYGPVASTLQDMLETGAYDLVALGTHGYRGLERFLLGSVAENTVRYAPCSVMVVHDAST